jgi:hypothetical protein
MQGNLIGLVHVVSLQSRNVTTAGVIAKTLDSDLGLG